jgi:PPK2 family polyphosphate:nucleotide phosphotransferase
VFQAMDAAGKDSTTRRVFGPVNPQGCRVIGFKAPSSLELAHDYLWRIHQHVPQRGMISVFNRSHYEDVLIVRVRGLVADEVWRKRYDHINDFERMLADEGVTILKFFLHISRDYQKRRLQRRLDKPDKHWKFNPADLVSRAQWDDYRRAYEDALGRCSAAHAPWYVVPAENRAFRDLLVAQVVVDALEGLDMRYPEPDYDPAAVRIE